MSAPVDHAFEELVGRVYGSHLDTICRELCEGVPGARPSHPRLISDVKNAAHCVARSRTFRELAAALAHVPANTDVDELLNEFQRACERVVVEGDALLSRTSKERAIARNALRALLTARGA